MKCEKCGFEHDIMSETCPNCEKPPVATSETGTPVKNHSNNKIDGELLALFNDKMFLTMCILLSTSCALTILGTSVPIFTLLITIFLWILFAGAKKGVIKENQINMISTTIRVEYILTNVVSIILIISGIVACLGMVLTAGAFETFAVMIMDFVEEEMELPIFLSLSTSTASFLLAAVISLGTTLSGLYYLIVNLLFMRKINGFVKSVHNNELQNDKNEALALSAKKWIFAYAIFMIVEILISSNPQIMLADGLKFASIIIGSMLIGKHLVPKNNF